MMTFTLSQQIEEIDRELKMRAEVYPRLVYRKKMRQGEADYQVSRLEAARASLVFLQENEDIIRAALEERRRKEGTSANAEVILDAS